MAAREAVIEVRSLSRTFGEQTVLQGLNLDVFRGEILVVMGGSGCGKSTLLRHLVGELQPSSGSIAVFGVDLASANEWRMDEIRKKFGMLFQSGALFNSMTVAENVSLPLREHTSLDPAIINLQVKINLERVGLREHADKYPAELSGGMKKRAGLARALALDPQVLFYDEPSAGLDPVTSAEIDQLIIKLSRDLGVTSVVVTHEMDSAFTIADRMCMLDRGRALRIGTRGEFDDLRKLDGPAVASLSESDQIIRQFLRGDAEGPLSARRTAADFIEDVLGSGSSRRRGWT